MSGNENKAKTEDLPAIVGRFNKIIQVREIVYLTHILNTTIFARVLLFMESHLAVVRRSGSALVSINDPVSNYMGQFPVRDIYLAM